MIVLAAQPFSRLFRMSTGSSQQPGRQVLLLAVILVGLGVVMVYSSSSALASDRFDDSGFFLERQAFRALAGLVLMFVVARVPLTVLQYLARPLLLIGLALLVLVLAFGEGKGAQRWLPFSLPLSVTMSFQPSEFVKLALVLYLADVLVRKEERIGEWASGLAPRLAVIVVAQCLILMQPDLGTAVAIGLISFAVLWLGGAGSLHLAATALAAVPVVAISLYHSPYQLQRVLSYFRESNPLTDGFQITQSLLAFGSGGLVGVGLGNSMQKHFLPEPHTDFVFALVGEELGLAGTLSVIGLFAALSIHGYRIALSASTHHGFLVAAGTTLMICVYAVLNMGVVTGLVPTTGLPLPFISYGGSSLMWNLCGIGILVSVARDGVRAQAGHSSHSVPGRSGFSWRAFRRRHFSGSGGLTPSAGCRKAAESPRNLD